MPEPLAVVVCSRDRPESLRRCLASLADQGADDLLVVDSASATGATGEVAREAGVRCIRLPEAGLARARNAALRATTADLVAFTDDDCRARPGWLDAIRARAGQCLDDSEPLGFLVGRVVPEGGGAPISVVLDTEPRRFTANDDTSHVGHGANLTVSRAGWAAVGGFDELLGVGARLRSGEDTDFLWRSLRAGYIGHYEPDAVVAHDQWRSRRAALRTSYGYGVGAGALRTKVRRLGGPQAASHFAAGSIRRTLAVTSADLRAGYEFGALSGIARAAGIAVGRIRARRLALDNGHLVAP